MRKCALCGKMISVTVCDECGYDESCNYGFFPTFGLIAMGMDSLTVAKRKWEAARSIYRLTAGDMGKLAVERIPAKERREKPENEGLECWCCGRNFFGTNCPHCNFIAIRDDSPEHAGLIRDLAMKHRQKIIEELTDFYVIVHCYQWNEKAGKTACAGEKHIRMADGVDCQNVFWSEPMFGQLPQDGDPVPISLSYRYQGVKRQVELEIPAVPGNDFWQIGLCIDSNLCLVVFLGDPVHFHTEKVKVDLKLK